MKLGGRMFWLVHEIDGERRVMIREDSTLIFAKVKAAIDGSAASSLRRMRSMPRPRRRYRCGAR